MDNQIEIKLYPLNSKVLVKCSDEFLDILKSDLYIRSGFLRQVKEIKAAYSSPLNYVGTFVISIYGDHIGKTFDISLQEVMECEGVIFADKDLI